MCLSGSQTPDVLMALSGDTTMNINMDPDHGWTSFQVIFLVNNLGQDVMMALLGSAGSRDENGPNNCVILKHQHGPTWQLRSGHQHCP